MNTSPASTVAMLCVGNEVYGIGTIQKIYARMLPELLFVCMRDGPLAQWLRDNGNRLIVLPGMAEQVLTSSAAALARMPALLWKARRNAHRLDALLRPQGIRLVHTHWLPQQLIALFLRRLGYCSVWQINNLTSRTRLLGLGLKLNHRFARTGADLLLPASDFIADFWRDNGVPVRVIHNAAMPVYAEPNELEVPPARCVVAGRLEESKGHHVAVEAVLAARRAGHDVSLDIFGGPVADNPYARRLLDAAERAGCPQAIQLRGFVNDLRQRHQQYHIGLQCRIDPEPCSLWVCEGLVDGLPILASANGGTPELVEDGVSGLLYRSGDANDLAEKLIHLLGNPSQLASMRRAAFARGRDHLLAERFIRETIEAWQAALP